MTSSCGRARRILWPESGPRSVDPDVAAARRHADECASCRAFFAEMAAMRDAVGPSIPRDEMPVALRETLFDRLAEARETRTGARWRWTLAAVAIVVFALAGFLVTRSDRSVEFLASAVVGEHASAVGGDRLASTDPIAVERWLASRLPFGVHVPVFREARLDGARICHSQLGRCAVVEYAIGERRLSYFVLPAPDRALSEERRITWQPAPGR